MASGVTPDDFRTLAASIEVIHARLAAHASKAVNISLTLRNLLIGSYIAEYELHGADRASYGDRLLERLAIELKTRGLSACGKRQLYNYLRFFQAYSSIVRSLPAQFQPVIPTGSIRILEKVPAAPALSMADTERLLNQLSYTHFEQLVGIDDPLKRTFYEVECMRGNWSVRELKRQIGSLYYERSGLSEDKEELARRVQFGAQQAEGKLAIRDPYVFEFLGLKSAEVMSESDLEAGLLDKLEEFLLELGHGFCFEARQKRILIGDTYGFVDLVFYHRILKCHVLVELKIEPFTHENLGQLNTYVSWYSKNMMTEGDSQPVGLLLCTQKDQTLAQYALSGIDNNLFVSKYQIELPRKEEIQRFLEQRMREVSDAE